jgi:hypothetical protein
LLQASVERGWCRAALGVRALVGFLLLVTGLWPELARAADIRTVMDLKGQIIAIVDSDAYRRYRRGRGILLILLGDVARRDGRRVGHMKGLGFVATDERAVGRVERAR